MGRERSSNCDHGLDLLTRLVRYNVFMSNAENLGFACRSPLLPPSVLILPVNPHQQNRSSASCAQSL